MPTQESRIPTALTGEQAYNPSQRIKASHLKKNRFGRRIKGLERMKFKIEITPAAWTKHQCKKKGDPTPRCKKMSKIHAKTELTREF